MKEHRCGKCGKLLFLGTIDRVDIKCSRCKTINSLTGNIFTGTCTGNYHNEKA